MRHIPPTGLIAATDDSDLGKLRRIVDAAMVAYLWLHVPLIAFAANVLGKNWLWLGGAATALSMAPSIVWRTSPGGVSSRMTISVGFVGMISLLLATFSGSPWQSDLHMYYFAGLAMLAAYCDRNVILTAALVTAVHHLALNFLLPALVFAEGANLLRVLLHAAIIIIESATLVWITQRMASLMNASHTALNEATLMRGQMETAWAAEASSRSSVETSRRQTLESVASQLEHEFQQASSGIIASAKSLGTDACLLTTSAAKADDNAILMRHSAQQTAEEVSAITGAIVQFSGAIEHIARQVAATAARAEEANLRSQHTTAAVATLTHEAQRIGEVIAMINDIAARTNLLALNATIEAARAGDSGKGFAVVATEVKSLAAQTARATETIQTQIEALQAGSSRASQAIAEIGDIISHMNSATASVAEAVAQQQSATSEISRSLQNAAHGVDDIQRAVGKVAEATGQTRASALRVTQEGERLGGLSGGIVQTTTGIIANLRAA